METQNQETVLVQHDGDTIALWKLLMLSNIAHALNEGVRADCRKLLAAWEDDVYSRR